MIHPSVNLVPRILQGALRPTTIARDDLQRAAQLGVSWLQAQQLAPLMWYQCQSRPDLPLDYRAALRLASYGALADTHLHARELSEVLQVLAAHGVTPVVFKGAALAHSVYPDPVCRLMGDLDLWVTVDEMDRAREALSTAGFVSRTNLTRPPTLLPFNSGEVQLHGTRPGTGLVELHFGVFAGEWLRRTANVDEVAIRNRVQPIILLGQRAHQLAPEDALIQLAVHAAVNHQLSLSALRSLVDVSLLARHAPLDWSVVVQRAREWRIATATWLVLRLAVDLCGLADAAEAVRQLQPSALRRRMIRRFANAESLVEMRDLSKSKWRYVYLLLMVDRKRDAVKLVYRTLWPERDWLIARYGRYTFSTRLRHLFDAARGKI